jgi:hypothetical protein
MGWFRKRYHRFQYRNARRLPNTRSRDHAIKLDDGISRIYPAHFQRVLSAMRSVDPWHSWKRWLEQCYSK